MTASPPGPAPWLSDLDKLAWPFTTDAPLLGDRLLRGVKSVIMLVDLTGLEWQQIAPLIPLIETMAAEKDMIPLLVIDRADPVSVSRSGLAYDALPDAAANATFHRGLDWSAYLARCRQLLVEKWQPGAIVHLGKHADW